jgi:hypothetical protein
LGTDQIETVSTSSTAAAMRCHHRGAARHTMKIQSGKRKVRVVCRTDPPIA